MRGAVASVSAPASAGFPASSPISLGEIRPDPHTLTILFVWPASISRHTTPAAASVVMNWYRESGWIDSGLPFRTSNTGFFFNPGPTIPASRTISQRGVWRLTHASAMYL